MNLDFPELFEERYSKIFGNNYNDFKANCQTKPPKTIRINTLKTNEKEVIELLEKKEYLLEKTKIENAYIVNPRSKRLGQEIEYQLGLFHIQDQASMLPPISLDPKKESTVLDLAAAPGSKTTQLAAQMKNTGVIIANDLDRNRIKFLKFNLARLGVVNTIITEMNAVSLSKENLFDYILLDAPCSNEGLIRKDELVLKTWNLKNIQEKALLQEKLVKQAFTLLKPGGTLVYSTCTIAPEENELIIQSLIENTDAKLKQIELPLKSHDGLTEWENTKLDNELKKTKRIFPHEEDTEAFFIAKITK